MPLQPRCIVPTKQQRNRKRLAERGGRQSSFALCWTTNEALDLICERLLITRRDALELAVLAAAIRIDTIDHSLVELLKTARDYRCSVVELRHLDGLGLK
jgi:hypothetical protein